MPGLEPFLPSLQLPPYVCRNCGFWQRNFENPVACPLCLDSRHVLPPEGWSFYDVATAEEQFPCHRERLLPGVWRIWNDPVDGIGSHSYLVQHEQGNVIFEGTAIYSKATLDFIETLGGVAVASSSHPHAYGALWQLQDHFGAEIALQTDDFEWSGALRVTQPFDEVLEIFPGLELVHTAVHFAGHTALVDKTHGILFCGDALKFELDKGDPRKATAIAAHKAFVRGVPLSKKETLRYKEIFARYAYDKTYTPFEQVHNVGTAGVDRFLDLLLAQYPQPEFIALEDL